MSATAPAYPAATLAKLFNLSERRVQQLAKQGVIPKAERGKYEFAASVRGYITYLQERALGRGDAAYNDENDLKFQRKRLIKAQADKTESEHQKLRGELVSLEAVELVLNEVAIIYASGVDALPGRLANELAGIQEPAEVKARLFDECQRVRSSTAQHLRRFAAHLARGKCLREPGGCAESKNAGSMG